MRHGGVEVDTQGDAFFFAFPTAPGALAASATFTEALTAEPTAAASWLDPSSPQRLVDELRFWIHPAVWGSGERPLQGEARNRLRLVGSDTFDSGVTLLRYAPMY